MLSLFVKSWPPRMNHSFGRIVVIRMSWRSSMITPSVATNMQFILTRIISQHRTSLAVLSIRREGRKMRTGWRIPLRTSNWNRKMNWNLPRPLSSLLISCFFCLFSYGLGYFARLLAVLRGRGGPQYGFCMGRNHGLYYRRMDLGILPALGYRTYHLQFSRPAYNGFLFVEALSSSAGSYIVRLYHPYHKKWKSWYG